MPFPSLRLSAAHSDRRDTADPRRSSRSHGKQPPAPGAPRSDASRASNARRTTASAAPGYVRRRRSRVDRLRRRTSLRAAAGRGTHRDSPHPGPRNGAPPRIPATNGRARRRGRAPRRARDSPRVARRASAPPNRSRSLAFGPLSHTERSRSPPRAPRPRAAKWTGGARTQREAAAGWSRHSTPPGGARVRHGAPDTTRWLGRRGRSRAQGRLPARVEIRPKTSSQVGDRRRERRRWRGTRPSDVVRFAPYGIRAGARDRIAT